MGDVIQFRKPEKLRQNVYYLPRGDFPSAGIDRWPDGSVNWVLLGGIGISLAIWAAIVTFAWSEFR